MSEAYVDKHGTQARVPFLTNNQLKERKGKTEEEGIQLMRYSCLRRVIIVPALKKGTIPTIGGYTAKKQRAITNKNHAKPRKISSASIHWTHKGEQSKGKGKG